MKRSLLNTLIIAVLLSSIQYRSIAQQKAEKETREDDGNGRHGYSRHSPGTWDATIMDGQAHIQLNGPNWNSGRDIPLAELGKLPNDKVGEFALTREAGRITFKGVFEDNLGRGTYKFEENEQFKAYLEQRGYKGLDQELMIHVLLTDINQGYFDFMKANGYATISNDQLRDLAEQNISRKIVADYLELFKTEGWGHVSLEKMIELREHGVNSKFVNSFHQMGYASKIPLDRALELRDHGVTPKYIASLTALGYKDLSLERATELRDHGITIDFIKSIQTMGYGGLTLEKAQELRDHGVTPDFISGIKKQGFNDLTLDKAVELRDHGVTVSYIEKIKSRNLDKVKTLDDYIRLRESGF